MVSVDPRQVELRLLHWPSWSHLAYAYGVLGPPLLLGFIAIYGGADYLTSLHSYRVPLHTELDRAMPLVPSMVLFYNSFHLVYLLAPFILRTRREMQALGLVWIAVTLCGAVVLLLWPAESLFPTPSDAELGPWRALFRLADRANLEFNYCPSLHVAWGVAGVEVFARRARRPARAVLWAWAIGLSLSTLLTHQHYLADVLAGFALGMAGGRLLYPALITRLGCRR